MRLDVYLSEMGLAQSRSRAQELIRCGCVFVGSKCITKASFSVSETDIVRVEKDPDPFVGRGGLKLRHALSVFQSNIDGYVFADIGASTGGFTDCLLQNGAKKIYAIDSGTAQLADKLRDDSRVIVMEQCNARYLTPEMLGESVDGVVTDVSFISLTLLIDAISAVLKPDGDFIALIKPQFEAGRAALDKKGIVKKESDRKRAVTGVILSVCAHGFSLMGLTPSPIAGGDGNREYLAYFVKKSHEDTSPEEKIAACFAAERNGNEKNLTDYQ